MLCIVCKNIFHATNVHPLINKINWMCVTCVHSNQNLRDSLNNAASKAYQLDLDLENSNYSQNEYDVLYNVQVLNDLLNDPKTLKIRDIKCCLSY